MREIKTQQISRESKLQNQSAAKLYSIFYWKYLFSNYTNFLWW